GSRPGGERLDLLLWTGWALIYGIVFSAAGGLFHAYYLVLLAPALAALAGIGTAALWSLYRQGGIPALALPGAVIATAVWQAYILDGYGRGTSCGRQRLDCSELSRGRGGAGIGLRIAHPARRRVGGCRDG